MSTRNGFKVAALAASIALVVGSTAVLAADPAANQLPGQGHAAAGVVTGTSTIAVTGGINTLTIPLAADGVITWKNGTAVGDINPAGTAGFNIGSAAAVNFTGGHSVLNIDGTGNPSQIFGALQNTGGSVFVANANGIIVGAKATITSTTGEVGLIANTLGDYSAFDGTTGTVDYAGTGGDVMVTKGAGISGTNLLVSGGGTVNVDLGAFAAGALALHAGRKAGTDPLVEDNPGAALNVSGTLPVAATLDVFDSAGNASTSGMLTLGGNAQVEGTLTNTGALTLDSGFAIDGALVNNRTVTQTDYVSMGSLVNSGAYAGGGSDLTTTDGGINNAGEMTDMGSVTINAGDFTNRGEFVSNGGLAINGGGNIVNQGAATIGAYVDINDGGNFTNAGTMALAASLSVVNGSITNSGKLSVDSNVSTGSDSTAGQGFTKGADYSITNTGTLTAAGGLFLAANADALLAPSTRVGSGNESTGSIRNTGILQVDTGGYLYLWAYNDVSLAGTVQAWSGSKYKALSATNALGDVLVFAGDYADLGQGPMLNADGVATVATDLTTGTFAQVYGSQVKLMGNLGAVDTDGAPTGSVNIIAGAKSDTDYAVRVASGKTVTAALITVDGDQDGDEPNVILQGTLAAPHYIYFGLSRPVSDVFSGPTGGLSMFNDGARPFLYLNFTGAVKTAKYNNASNFRFNGLPVNVTDGSLLYVQVHPSAYQTNGTSNGLSAVNLLVNSDVTLISGIDATVHAGDTAVTGVTNTPNTHLVLQSSGNIGIGDGADFYWPGYVYLGNVAADADGHALPGTLGLGTIAIDGEFNNVLPGDVAGASGIHFITQFPLTLGGDVVTNANAWVNFGTGLLTQAYAAGIVGGGQFFGGLKSSGRVVNYDALDASLFHTHAPDANR